MNKFLKAAAQNTALQEKLKLAANPEEFINIASELGYTIRHLQNSNVMWYNRVSARKKDT